MGPFAARAPIGYNEGLMIAPAIHGIFTVNLGVRRTERVLVFTDKPTARESTDAADLMRRERLRDVAALAAETARGVAGEVVELTVPATGAHGKEPPRKLWVAAFGEKAVAELDREGLLRKLLAKRLGDADLPRAEAIVARHRDEAVAAVVALTNYSTSHTRFRDLLTRMAGARYASMPLFDPAMLEGAMLVDWKALARRTGAVARAMQGAVAAEITTPNGTELRLGLRGRRALADTGLLTKAGAFGNLPAGEAYVAPVEGTTEGVLVAEWGPTRKLSRPLVMTVSGGEVIRLRGGGPYAIELEKRLSQRRENRNIAELGIGTNDRATRPDNILESEKILGTIHIALGDNSSFGGLVKTPFHQDFVFFHPTVVLVGRSGGRTTLLERGKLLPISG